MQKNISIYVRNHNITPSSYYRIFQYAREFDGNINIRDIAPSGLYKKHLNIDKNNKVKRTLISLLYYVCIIIRVVYYLLEDLINKPQIVILSKTFCPRYTPFFLRFLINKVTEKTIFYWDFDDYIFQSGEISSKQAEILKKNSNAIIVTNNFLKERLESKYHEKVILLPTTDGDLQGFNNENLLLKRSISFKNEIKLVWVATSGNLPNLLKIVEILDKTALEIKKKFNKKMILTVVCNKPLEVNVNHLLIINKKWTRELAKNEIYDAHIGIMPLLYKEYSLGKGGFKLVQYISTGLPVIASNVGYNNEVVINNCGILVDDKDNNELWLDSVMNIVSSWESWLEFSNNAHTTWNEKFSFDNNLRVWKELLKNN